MIRLWVEELAKQERTVSFETAVWASVEARAEVPQVQEREIVPLRREEVARLQARDVQTERGCVVVPGRCSKTGGGRVVPLRRREALRGGRLRIPRNWEERWRRLRRAAGFAAGQWVPDVCRHTFASYHAARFRDLGALQLEMGHRSTDLLRSRYLNLPQVEEAKRYWASR